MKIDIKEHINIELGKRLKYEREKVGFRQTDVWSSDSAISNIEKGKKNGKLTESILDSYQQLVKKDRRYLLFGDEKTREELIEWVFFLCFSLCMLPELTEKWDVYSNTFYGKLLDNKDDDTKLQSAMIKIAELFGQYNLKRFEYLASSEKFMDFQFKMLPIDEERDIIFVIDELWESYQKLKNTDKLYLNWAYFMDYPMFFRKVWTHIKEDIITHFSKYYIDSIVGYDKFSSDLFNKRLIIWMRRLGNDIDAIVSKIISENTIFKLGVEVKDVLNTIDTEKYSYFDIEYFINKMIGFSKYDSLELVTKNSVVNYELEKQEQDKISALKYFIDNIHSFDEKIEEELIYSSIKLHEVINEILKQESNLAKFKDNDKY
ncbi:hypothetical protein [Streptococcus hyointestinalis]|uniref:hypothetical protein n=1 Tax=Streptococcus hyointestinalis TaxID=1337 RepID=UPI003D060238